MTADQYLGIRKHSEEICAPLQKEDYVVQPVVDVSPPKWHLAHSTWFWEEFVLAKYQEGYRRFHPRYSFLFNSYYNGVGDRVLRLHRGNMSRPTVDEIFDYRHHVDQHMAGLLRDLPPQLKDLVALGINHEQQHQELLYTDIKYILGHNPLFPAYQEQFRESTPAREDQGFVDMPGGSYTIGFRGEGFSFDNEHHNHEVKLEAFSISDGLVTNGAYLQFIEDGGYKDPLYWHSDGWSWVVENQVEAPLYWHRVGTTWSRYSLFGFGEVNPHEPVTHVSFYEAAAFASWRGMRLPTEFEWEAACDRFNWGQRWEHTNSSYLPYPGFSRAAGAIGEYNGKFMVNQMVLRGSSIVTPSGHSRKTYRNFFHPQLRWQFNGIRLCKNNS